MDVVSGYDVSYTEKNRKTEKQEERVWVSCGLLQSERAKL